MRFFLTKRSVRSKIIIILFILLFLTVITSLFVSNAVAADGQGESDILTFSSLGIGTKTLSSVNGQETSETLEFDVDINDNTHNRYSLHLQYVVGANRPSIDFDIVLTINDEHTVKDSIFRFIERDTKHWRHIEIPYTFLKDGTNTITISISFKSLANAVSTFTFYSESYFEITKITLIQSTGEYQLPDLVVLPTSTYEDRLMATGSIGGFYSGLFEPQVEFFLQGNMTSVGAQLDITLQKDVPNDCEVTYNIYVNDKALYDEDKEFGDIEISIQQPLTLQAGRNSIRFQIQISSYRVVGEGGGETPYTFVLRIDDSSQISFSSSSFDTSNNEGSSTIDLPNILLFSLVVGLLIFIPSFLVITFGYKRRLVKEIKAHTLSYVDANDSGKIKTLRIREETS